MKFCSTVQSHLSNTANIHSKIQIQFSLQANYHFEIRIVGNNRPQIILTFHRKSTSIKNSKFFRQKKQT